MLNLEKSCKKTWLQDWSKNKAEETENVVEDGAKRENLKSLLEHTN